MVTGHCAHGSPRGPLNGLRGTTEPASAPGGPDLTSTAVAEMIAILTMLCTLLGTPLVAAPALTVTETISSSKNRACMFRPSDDTYRRCVHASQGRCHHYTTACTPPGECMFRPSDDTYRRCVHVSQGRCHHYTTTCTPPGKCMFNPADQTYRRCVHVSQGRCHHYTTACTP